MSGNKHVVDSDLELSTSMERRTTCIRKLEKWKVLFLLYIHYHKRETLRKIAMQVHRRLRKGSRDILKIQTQNFKLEV